MQLNWRGKAAKIQAYFEQGEGVTHKLRQLAITGAALKILGLPTWAIVAGTPFLFISYIVIGYVWINHGWYKQNTEIAVVSRWSPIQIWQMNAIARCLDALFPQGVAVSTRMLDPRIAAGFNSHVKSNN